MKVVVDENIPCAAELLAPLAELRLLPGRAGRVRGMRLPWPGRHGCAHGGRRAGSGRKAAVAVPTQSDVRSRGARARVERGGAPALSLSRAQVPGGGQAHMVER